MIKTFYEYEELFEYVEELLESDDFTFVVHYKRGSWTVECMDFQADKYFCGRLKDG